MKDLLDYLIKNTTGVEEFEIDEGGEGGFTRFTVKTPSEKAGLIIGKGGKTIRAIRNILKVKATLEKVGVSVSVEGE